MIDLTPLDVRKKRGDFRRLLRGYDPEEVDTFMDLVADRFEELVRENLHLSEKTESLQTQLEALVGRERAVQDALVSILDPSPALGPRSSRIMLWVAIALAILVTLGLWRKRARARSGPA